MQCIRKTGAILFVSIFTSFAGFAQDHSVQIQQLLLQRIALASNNQSYSGIEKQIVELGQFPSALVNKTMIDGKQKFDFTAYKQVQPEKEAIIAGRIKVSIPGIESVVISNQQVSVIFETVATADNIADFFKLMGYNSYEIKTN